MAHTHTLEIITPNVNLISEKSFDNGGEASISIQAVSMKKNEHMAIDELIRVIDKVYKVCGGITKIELKAKP